jgi:hypothetical protein
VRYIGVDLHKTNFVVCFLNEDDTSNLATFPLSKAGIKRFTEQLKKDDALAVEAGAEHLLLLRPDQSLRRAHCVG